ncbi:unnamed protein product [Caretta caretta]
MGFYAGGFAPLHTADPDSEKVSSVFLCSGVLGKWTHHLLVVEGPQHGWITVRGIPVSTFLKRDVFHGLIYYHHLEGEIFQDLFDFILSDCLEPPNLSGTQFEFSVSDQQDVVVAGFNFNITVMPVDDEAPEIFTDHLTTEEGASFFISGENLMVSDLDTRDDDLRIQLKKCPQYGHIELHGLIQEGDMFTLEDLQSYKVRYQHDDSETLEDIVIFSATDGFNTADGVLRVQEVK